MIEIIVAIVSGVLAGGLSPFLFLRQNKDANRINLKSGASCTKKNVRNEKSVMPRLMHCTRR